MKEFREIKEIELDKWKFKLLFETPYIVKVGKALDKGDRVVFTHEDTAGNKFESNVVIIKGNGSLASGVVEFYPEVGHGVTHRLLHSEDIFKDYETSNPIVNIEGVDYGIILGQTIKKGGFLSDVECEVNKVYDLCFTDFLGYKHIIKDVLVTSCPPSTYFEGKFFPTFEINREVDGEEIDDYHFAHVYAEDDEDEDDFEGEGTNKTLSIDWDYFEYGSTIAYAGEFVTPGVYDLIAKNPQGETFVKKNVEVKDCWEAHSRGEEGKWACEFRAPIGNVIACIYKPEDSLDNISDAFEAVGSIDKVGDDPTNPNYYKNASIELIDYMEETSSPEAFQGYCKNNVIKYVVRYKDKNGIEDLNKAMWYLKRLIDSEEKC